MLTGNYGDSDHDLAWSKARATTKIAVIPRIQAIRKLRAVTLARDISRIYDGLGVERRALRTFHGAASSPK
jgi:hypothetical protein